jgi:hypothetical protein
LVWSSSGSVSVVRLGLKGPLIAVLDENKLSFWGRGGVFHCETRPFGCVIKRTLVLN